MLLKNTSVLGQIDLHLIGREGDPIGEPGAGCLEPGETFEVPDDIGARLLEQVGNFELVKAKTTKGDKP